MFLGVLDFLNTGTTAGDTETILRFLVWVLPIESPLLLNLSFYRTYLGMVCVTLERLSHESLSGKLFPFIFLPCSSSTLIRFGNNTELRFYLMWFNR